MYEDEIGSVQGATEEFESIRQAIDGMANTRGEAVFLISPETGRVLTFAGLQEKSRAISGLLREAGLERGDKVAFLLDNGLFTAQLFLGTMYAGLVSVPLNVRAGVAQLASTLDHCDAKVVFVEDQYKTVAEEALAGVSRAPRVISADLDSFADASPTPFEDGRPAPPAGEDPALLMYSSGSVGRAKAAIHSHRTLLAQARNSILSHCLTRADRSLLVLPLYHINAECVTLIPTLMSGGSVVAPHHFAVSQFWDLLEEYRCTWSAVVPTIISQLLDWRDPRAASRKSGLHRVRFLRSSSAPLSPSLHREFLNKFEFLLIQAMGSTEAGNIFSNPQPPGENKIGSPGLAWGFETRIINRNGADVPAGEPGEILIRGPAVMQGYYKDPDGTAAVLDPEGWLHTGDLAYQDQDGYFFVVGRAKELIIKGGMNIAPRQIDEVLESHPAILEAAAVGVPDRYMGEDVVAFAVLRAGMTGDEREMLAFCESRLGHFKTPTRIHFVADLPKGPSGKVQRLRLLDNAAPPVAASTLYTSGYGDRAAEPPPALTIEQTIVGTWAELLGQARVDPDSNFFSLGGDSLTALKCLSKIRDKFPVVLSLADFFENPTAAQQAALVRSRLSEACRTAGGRPARSTSPPVGDQVAPPQPIGDRSRPQPIPPRARPSTYPLSPRQRRLWFIRELAPGVPHYNESEAVRLKGDLKVDALQQALDAIVARHEVLRTTFQRTEEGAVAFVHESWPLRMRQIDLTGLADPQRDAEVERLLIDEPRRFYNLESEPGVRVTLLRLGAREHAFILMMHHIICDRWSINVLWGELATVYEAFVCGTAPALPPLPIQHGDYALWQLQRLAEGEFAEDLAYWEDALRGAPELLELPADRPRPHIQSHQGVRKRLRLDGSLTAGLRDRSRQEKTSLFTVFAAALNTLLYRYTGSEDLVVGVPIADRERDEAQSLVGFLVDTHALRTRLSGDMTFRELLARIQTGLVALYSHREIPFDEIVRRVQRERDLSHGPLFQVVINGQSRTQRPFEGVDGLVGELLVTQTKTSKADLTLYLGDSGDDIWLELEYSTDLFDEDRIARMCGHYQTLLASVEVDPDQRLSQAPILTAEERRQVLYDWNDTRAEFPRDKCIHELFEEQAGRTPDADAAAFEGAILSYRELNQRANRLAHYLRRLGVAPDARVAICLERGFEMIVALLAVLKAGGAYVPLDPSYPAERLAYMLEDCAPAALLTQGRLRQLFEGLNQGPAVVDPTSDSAKWADQSDGNPDRASMGLTPAHLAYVIYTSGSTGKPKGVMIEHRGVCNLIVAQTLGFAVEPDSRVLQFASFSFDACVSEIFTALCRGALLDIPPSGSALAGPALLERIKKRGVTHVTLPPTVVATLPDNSDLSPLRTLVTAGEAAGRALVGRRSQGLRVINAYGPTEITVCATMFECSGKAADSPPIGRPILNSRVYILDPRREPVPIGVSGEIYIGGVGVARGYLNRPELTTERFISNPFVEGDRLYRTGDLGRYLADGNIEFLGRNDFQVKIRGFRIELGEIEARLAQHPSVRQAVVLARKDPPGEERLVAYYIVEPGADEVGADALRRYLAAALPEYMIPAAYVRLGAFPLTANGKLDRKALPAPTTSAYSAPAYEAPKGETETGLAQIWMELLKLDRVGRHDNFFELGGHSLLAVRVMDRLNKTFQTRLGAGALFIARTIETLARTIDENRRNEESWGRVHPLRNGEKGPPLYFIGAGPVEHRLAELVSNEHAVFAVDLPIRPEWRQAMATGNLTQLPTLHQLGTLYGEILRTHAGSTPCVVAGYSFFGKIAFEAAHALMSAGGKVAYVLLIDAYAMTRFWGGWRNFAKGAVYAIGESQNPRPALVTAGRMLWWLLSRQPLHFSPGGRSRVLLTHPRPRPAVAEVRQRIRGQGVWNEWVEDEQSVMHLAPFIANQAAPLAFKSLDAKGVLIRARISGEESLPGQYLTNGWGDLFARSIEVIQAPGGHASLVRDPTNRLKVARAIESTLDRYGTPAMP